MPKAQPATATPKPTPTAEPTGQHPHTRARVVQFVIPLIILLTDRGEICAHNRTDQAGILSRNNKPQCINLRHWQKRTPPD